MGTEWAFFGNISSTTFCGDETYYKHFCEEILSLCQPILRSSRFIVFSPYGTQDLEVKICRKRLILCSFYPLRSNNFKIYDKLAQLYGAWASKIPEKHHIVTFHRIGSNINELNHS